VFLYCGETTDPRHQFHARMYAPGMGIVEDPATGSAAAAFAGVLARFASLDDADHTLTIEQGYAMGRPSLIGLTVTLRDGKLTAASIGGDAIIVTQGTIEA
jgi:trans-2,3-dihydro-3-hydroxyanthranilate isomerase